MNQEGRRREKRNTCTGDEDKIMPVACGLDLLSCLLTYRLINEGIYASALACTKNKAQKWQRINEE